MDYSWPDRALLPGAVFGMKSKWVFVHPDGSRQGHDIGIADICGDDFETQEQADAYVAENFTGSHRPLLEEEVLALMFIHELGRNKEGLGKKNGEKPGFWRERLGDKVPQPLIVKLRNITSKYKTTKAPEVAKAPEGPAPYDWPLWVAIPNAVLGISFPSGEITIIAPRSRPTAAKKGGMISLDRTTADTVEKAVEWLRSNGHVVRTSTAEEKLAACAGYNYGWDDPRADPLYYLLQSAD